MVTSEVVQLTQQLVRFESVNPPGNEEQAIRHLGSVLDREGIAVAYQRLAENRLNLIARLPGPSSEGLVLCGHIDVVPAGSGPWDVSPFEGAISDGHLIGRGSADMKGGVAAMATALIELHRDRFAPKAGLILAITAGEEAGMDGARLMASTDDLAGASRIVIGEPTGLQVFRAEKGVLWLEVIVRGRTAHGSMPSLGINAVTYVARLVNHLEEYPFPFESSDILSEPTLSVNMIEGGVKVNVVPDYCRIEIDMRLVPGQNSHDIIQKLRKLMQDTAADLPVRIEINVLQDVPPIETPADDALIEATVDAVGSVQGKKPSVEGVSYGTDGAILAPALDASLVIIGPGAPEQAHQPNEYVETAELEQAVEIYERLARGLL